jgi:hypothetical protein
LTALDDTADDEERDRPHATAAGKELSMPKPSKPRRKPVTSDPDRAPLPRRGVTSDPDRGVAVNSATDPQRPGTAPRPAPDTSPPGTSAEETSVTTDRFNATRQPASPARGEDVEGSAAKGKPEDAL